jgi:CRP-like cAMP-binding protein
MTVTAEPTGVRLTNDELRQLFLFEALTEDQLSWFAERGWVTEVPSGSTVFAEGDPAELMMVLLSGTIAMSRRVGQDDVETVRTEQVGVYGGAMQSYLGGEAGQSYTATVTVISDARLWLIRASDFGDAVRDWFP